MALKIFFCYAHEDELLLNKIKMQLKPLERQGLIEMWYDREIRAGMEWEHEIDKHLSMAQIILLMISPDFINAEYCYDVEVKQAIERHKRGDARVIPIILRPIYWQGEFGMLQALPKDALPVTDWDNIDKACFNVAEGIRAVVQELNEKKPPVILAEDAEKVVVVAARKALPESQPLCLYLSTKSNLPTLCSSCILHK